MANFITGKVIKVIDDYKIVINKGSTHGVTDDSRFLIYREGEELFDPDTKESLGSLELVCGEGTPEHIQPQMTTLYSAKTVLKKTKTVRKTGPYGGLFGNSEETYDPEITYLPFENVDTDCIVKQLK